MIKTVSDGGPFSCMSNARPCARDANTKANQGIILSPQELKLAAASLTVFSREEFRYYLVIRYFPLIPTSFLVSLDWF